MSNTTQTWHNARIRIDDETSAAVDISGNANLAELTESYRTSTYQVFGNPWDQTADGGQGWKAKFKIFFSANATETYRDILSSWKATRGLRTVEISVPDGEPGSLSYTGDARLNGDVVMSIDRSSDDVGMVEFEVVGHDSLVEAVLV